MYTQHCGKPWIQTKVGGHVLGVALRQGRAAVGGSGSRHDKERIVMRSNQAHLLFSRAVGSHLV